MTTVAIMQPTYLPWMGYFGLMDRVDTFVLLDCVQFARRSWQQRNQIKTAQGAQWLSVPVLSKGLRDQAIRDVQVQPDAGFPGKHVRGITDAYGKARFFADHAAGLFRLLEAGTTNLAEMTCALIDQLRQEFAITTPLVMASSLHPDGAKANLLAAICHRLGATRYLSPPGSRVYLDDSRAFEELGIEVAYFTYQHPEYPQLHGPFLPYMSAIDLLFNCGADSLSVIRSGVGADAETAA